LNSPAQSSSQTQASTYSLAQELLQQNMTIAQIQQYAQQNGAALLAQGITPDQVMTIATQINQANLGTQSGWQKFLKAGQL
jgi:oligoendopeptidase F